MREAIICGDELPDRFKELLDTYTHVDIATAWATGGQHLRALADAASRRPLNVRAIVGTTGNATRPDALEALRKITNGELRIISEGGRLFHPKVYLFGNGIVTHQAWIGSANFTNMGFGGHSNANEEIMLEVGPGEKADELADWFQDRWDYFRTDTPVSEVIRQYTEDWKRRPPSRDLQQIVSGSVSARKDLLDDAHRPSTIEEYRQTLKRCEEILRDEQAEWGILDPRGKSYMRVIRCRSELLLGDGVDWKKLKGESRERLKGGRYNSSLNWWGLVGRLVLNWPTVRDHQTEIRATLDMVVKADDSEFPDIAIDAMQELRTIEYVGPATATLLLTLSRPDRLLSLNRGSKEGLEALCAMNPTTAVKPENYREMLLWLYGQPWYRSPPTDENDEELKRIWRYRAALVDAFVYKST